MDILFQRGILMKKANRAIPNYRLIEERKQRNWSQRDVADRIGTTTINVCRWERGITSPSRYFRDLLCELFGRSAEDLDLFSWEAARTRSNEMTRALVTTVQGRSLTSLELPAQTSPSSCSPAPVWYVPYRRNPFFTGHEAILSDLSAALDPDKPATQELPPAITGLGGIGKTQVAVEYAYRYAHRYQAVLRANAKTRETLLKDFAAIAANLHLPLNESQGHDGVIGEVLQWLEGHNGWLFIFDNIADFTTVTNFLPRVQTGRLLFVTRRRVLGPFARCIELDIMTPLEGALLLLHRAKLLPLHTSLTGASEKQLALAMEVSQAMGGLPLALDQIGAYMEESTCELSELLAHYQLHRTTLLDRRGTAIPGHLHSVSRTYTLEIEQLEQDYPEAANLARLCAFLAPAAIPEELIRQALASIRAEKETTPVDAFVLGDAVNELYRRSLLQYHAEVRTFTIHPLVQIVLRDTLSADVQREWIDRVLHTVSSIFAEASEQEAWQLCQRCLPHAYACIAFIEQWGINSPDARSLLHHMHQYTRTACI